MAFVPTGPSVPAEDISWSALFGSSEKNSAAIKGAEAFRDAAKAGKFAVDPDQAKRALRELDSAEEDADNALTYARSVARRPEIGGSDFALSASDAYYDGGDSALQAALAAKEVISAYREGVEAAMNNYRRMDDGAAGTFERKA
jgi:hypothetical protein